MNRDRRIVVIKGAGESKCCDRRTKTPAEMTQPLDEMRGQPEIVGTQLTIVFSLTERRVGKGLPIGIDELVFFQLFVEVKGVEQHMRVLDPQRIVGDRLDFMRCLQYPAPAPGIDDAMLVGRSRQEGQRQFQDNRMAILYRPRVLARKDKPEIAVLVLLKAIAFPGQRARRQLLPQAVAPLRELRIVI